MRSIGHLQAPKHFPPDYRRGLAVLPEFDRSYFGCKDRDWPEPCGDGGVNGGINEANRIHSVLSRRARRFARKQLRRTEDF